VTTIPLAPPLLAGSSDLPGDLDGPSNQRCSAGRLPIWSCSVRGFACHPCYHGRGALLPHLFTIARLRPCGLRRGWPCDLPLAVYFLCHCPSGCPDRGLPGALPCGVRTFLPPSRLAALRRAIIWLAATIDSTPGRPVQPSCLSIRLLRDLILLELLVQIAARRADHLGRLRDVPPVLAQLAHQEIALGVLLELPQRPRLRRLAVAR
jgi:hypothetical protein